MNQQGLTTFVGIDALLEINARHSREFNDQVMKSWRKEYRREHPAEIGVLKCMDGRLHFPVMTKTPLGIIQPFRNLGGKFNVGWHGFQSVLDEYVDYSLVIKGRSCILIVTIHFSKGDRHRGCRGFHYDREAAYRYAAAMRKQIQEVYGEEVIVIFVEIETDDESLILHGESGETIDLTTFKETDEANIFAMLGQIYPNMPTKVVRDLVPLVQGNIKHTQEIQALDRPITETEHKEWVLGIGRGFDWLHAINTALLVGPYDPDLSETIETAAGLLLDNLVEGRISGQGIVLMASAPYRENEHERRRGQPRKLAIEKASFYGKYSYDVISASPKLKVLTQDLQFLTACVNVDTRELEVIERRQQA